MGGLYISQPQLDESTGLYAIDIALPVYYEDSSEIIGILRATVDVTAFKDILRAGEIELDRASRTVAVNQQLVDLTPSEFDLLANMMASPGGVFSRLELLERLQGSAYEGYERTIDVHIRNLRTKIEPDPSQPRYIETVYGTGYRFANMGREN